MMCDMCAIQNVECEAETQLALLIRIPSKEAALWVPKKKLSDESDLQVKGDKGILVVQRTWADENSVRYPRSQVVKPGTSAKRFIREINR